MTALHGEETRTYAIGAPTVHATARRSKRQVQNQPYLGRFLPLPIGIAMISKLNSFMLELCSRNQNSALLVFRESEMCIANLGGFHKIVRSLSVDRAA